MPMSRRAERVADLIREEVSELLRKEIDDPRLKSGVLVSITEVEIGDDLRYAKLFVSVLGTPEQTKDAFAALRHAESFLRKALSPRLQLRYLPEIHFLPDESIKMGARVEELIQQLHQEEKA
jgi:ribosome-binding factor A